MKSIPALALAAALAAATSLSLAADPAQHEHHQPDKSAAAEASGTAAKPAAAPDTSTEQKEKMDAQMKRMQEMHEKMMAAKTPEERNALMAEHMKAMQGGMAMMDGMKVEKGAGKQAMSPQMMQKQIDAMQKKMEMMEGMMQMMMDRIGPSVPAK